MRLLTWSFQSGPAWSAACACNMQLDKEYDVWNLFLQKVSNKVPITCTVINLFYINIFCILNTKLLSLIIGFCMFLTLL